MSVYRAAALLGQPVIWKAGDQDNKAKISHILVDPNNGRLLGLVTKLGLVGLAKIESKSGKLLVEGVSLSAEEKDSTTFALKNRNFLIKKRVETESGHYLGRVSDFEFDDVSWRLERIFVSDRALFRALSSELQIPRDDILFMDKDKVIVRDGLIKRSSGKESKTEASPEYVGVGSGAALSGK